MAIGQLFTCGEMEKLKALHDEAREGTFAQRAAEEIIEPLLPRINAVVGHENDARYLAYAVEAAILTNGGGK